MRSRAQNQRQWDLCGVVRGLPGAQYERTCLSVQEMQEETQVPSLGREDLPEKEMATCSSILAGKIPHTGEPGELQSLGWQRVRHDSIHTQFVPRQVMLKVQTHANDANGQVLRDF